MSIYAKMNMNMSMDSYDQRYTNMNPLNVPKIILSIKS